MSIAPYFIAPALFQVGLAANLGGFGENTHGGDDSTPKTETQNTPTTTGTTTPIPEKLTRLTASPEQTAIVTDKLDSGVSYNKWGFTGSQSVWTDQIKDSSSVVSGSESHGSSTATISSNKTSGALRAAGASEISWKTTAIVGVIAALTISLHTL